MASIAPRTVVIIGGGPAGLTAAYELVKRGIQPIVLEKADKVGGLARTETYKGFRFDMGGHRFYTKSQEVKKMWEEVLGKDFLRRPRLSRIYYNRKFFHYPLKPLNVLFSLGLLESIRIVLSYLWWHFFPHRQEETFEHWVTNRFGQRLFLTFFKTYTEKVWGIPCSELKAEWAAQRIKDLSLKRALLHMFLTPKNTIRTLIEEFDYPRLGPGMMWNAVKEKVEKQGGIVKLNAEVVRIVREGKAIRSVVIACNGHSEHIQGTHFISSMPVTEFIKKLDPPSSSAFQAAEKLHYREFLTVCLIVNQPNLFPDNWIYVHDPAVKVGRIQNFKNWSPEMVPSQKKTSLGLEYFCTQGDGLWTMSDADLIDLGKQEVDRIGLAKYADIEDGCVFRVEKAYPVYDSDYRDHLEQIRKFVDGLDNFMSIGRNGLHRYNNQDHAMLTGMMGVRNLVSGTRNDLWSVNTDQEYHEEVQVKDEVETEEVVEAMRGVLAQVFLKLDRVALGLSLGITSGLLWFLATVLLLLKGGEVVGPNLQLLSQYFPGYRVSATGSMLGLAYGFITGFIGGWGYAFLRNVSLFFYMSFQRLAERRLLLRRLLEYI